MLFELRTYTVKPDSLSDMVKAASTLARDIRKDDYGKLEGYWLTEIGPLIRSCICGAMPILANVPDYGAPLARIRVGLASISR